jgi:nucleotide-binding universal stress UspA family protein
MAYATLMTYVEAEGLPEGRIRLAASLADKFNATLIGVSAIAPRPSFVTEGIVVEEVVEAELKEHRAKLAGKEQQFRALTGDRRKTEWRGVLGFPSQALAVEARSADLVVIGRSAGPGDAYSALDAGDAILRLGRPALVVPDGVSALRAEHVVIGWKDTREARRALQDCLPFLHEATRVTIVEICASGEEEQASQHISDVANYLARHRIKSGPKVILHQHGPAAAQLIRLAHDEDADLLITGAYGHSRVGEWLFGGMTRDLLATSPFCCLMSH